MEKYIMWGGIGVFALFLLIGLVAGLVRGLKRSSLHILFLVGSVALAFFITKPVTTSVLNSNITVDGTTCSISDYIINLVQSNFDLSSFATASEFLAKIPNAVVSPILFILLTLGSFIVFDIIYLIVARVSFGSKKKDFSENKPHRWFGGLVGVAEGFMFLFILFAPITSLTNTYETLAKVETTSTSAVYSTAEGDSAKLKTISETLATVIPQQVNDAILAYNKCLVGKVAGAGGLNDALFDGLSDFKLDGEKIEFRKEILSMANVYDEVVVVYNDAIVDNNYENLDLTTLKANLEKFMNNGIFKTVVSNTIRDLVVNFEDLKTSLNLTNLPQIVQDIITELQTKFADENFDTYEYLRNDILRVVDTFDLVLKNDLINKFNNLEDKTFVGILNFVDENNEIAKTLAQNLLNLNVVKDSFQTLGNFASQEIENALQNDQGLEIKLNTEVADTTDMLNDVLNIVDKFLDLNNTIDIAELLTGNDIIASLESIDNLDTVITKIGSTFDDVRNLEILVLPVNETRTEKVYVFDNILSLYNFDILNDEVYLTKTATTKTKLDTYTKFFNFVKTPIVEAQKLGLMELGQEGTSFDTILSSVLTELKTNEELLSDIMLPFYQLSVLDLKSLVFDKVVDTLSDSANTNGLIDFTQVSIDAASDTTTGGVSVWRNELILIGKTLNALNKGAITVSETTKTYLDCLLSGDVEMNEVMKQMVNADDLKTALDPIFTATSFKGLVDTIFENIDKAIGDITGVVPTTVLTNLSSTKTQTINAIQSLLETTLNNESMTLVQVGQILDVLKTNAYNQTAKDGVFNEIFANLIWYMTGDDITTTGKYATATGANENAQDIKAYLNIESTDNYVGYYTVESYEAILSEIQDSIDFAQTLSENVSNITLSPTTIEQYFNGVKLAITSLSTKTFDEKAEVINGLKKLIDGNSTRQGLLTDDDITNYGEEIVSAITKEYGTGSSITNALKNLLGL